MKRFHSLFLATALAFPAAAAAVEAGDETERAAVIETLTAYARGADDRDAERVEGALHPESMQYLFAGDGIRAIDRQTYLGLLRAGKIGGKERSMEVEYVDITEGVSAFAKVQLRQEKRAFLHYVSLLKVDDTWQIASISTLVGNIDE